MADWRRSGSRKQKWSSSTEMSPSKYLKSNESKIPRGANQDRGSESPSPPRERRRVSLYPSQSTPKYRSDSRSGDRSSERVRSRSRGDKRVQRPDFHESSQVVTPADVPGKSASREERNDHTKLKETPKSRTRENRVQCALFKRAVSDILGTPSRARRSLVSEDASPQGLESREEISRPDPKEAARTFPAVQPNSPVKEPARERSLERKDIHLGKSRSHGRAVADPLPERGADVLEETRRLVFLYEDDKDSDTGDIPEKDPSIGSDFSDLEDVGPLARFSQEDEVEPCCSVEDHRELSSPNYVMYPRQLYGSPWRHYKDVLPSSPMYRPPAEQDTWRQEAHNSSCVTERSANVLDNSNVSLSSDIECTTEKSRQPLGSLHSPWNSPTTSLDYGFIDTHCHLDMLFSRLSHKSSFAALRRQFASTFPREFQGCITDYCDPRTLQKLPWQQILNEDMVWGAFGCHPHFAQYYNDRLLDEMMKALRHPKAIAFGEMGLDYSHKCSTVKEEQHQVFEKQLKVAVPLGKPLVIHCRDADEDLFKIMKKWVPRDYKIHRHCFTGSYKDIEPFLDQFPNMAVGFTAVLTYNSAAKVRDAVTRIPLERLIVETDAPFFVPRQVPKSVCKFSHPGLALHTVQEIARLRNLPIKELLLKLRENTLRIYNI
ncbi:putative deoxyribonuclease TATDN2 [Pseudophryne corroboree]|uniref:putative deoxyribonuclease TATDN2 n=1 Tax=Pseudophryne corroboree TaxID=495146 RepID=UPI0030820C3C